MLVVNPRKLALIWSGYDKSDEKDARILGMVCRVEPRLLWPITPSPSGLGGEQIPRHVGENPHPLGQ